ncbi:fas apoptotic inhibitory molecule 2b [Denticeps clupeoides]|uniref:Protein lifeguard 2 n=1 Tax=Denticeps clupeoides TaxID=299321 RepID=A0AAY4DAJ5_9TELE|nr:protein lifeguard 2-like [Denticeps clupeoides]
MTQKKVAPMIRTVDGSSPPSYEEANQGCPGYYYVDGEQVVFCWDDTNIRRVFIRKVYTILMTQMLTTLAIVSLFLFCAPVRIYIQTHPGLYSISYLVFLVTFIILSCCGEIRRQFPWNLILLCVFTLSMAFMLGFISSFYNTKSVMLCIGITAMVCLSVTIFSFQTKVDFTSFQGVLFVLCMVMFFCAILMGIIVPFGYVPWLHALYAVIGSIVFTMFLAFDTQVLLGNKQYAISPEEYVFATLSLYLDIIYLFNFLLQIFGGSHE